MSPSSDPSRAAASTAVLSDSADDLLIAGVVVELDARDAEQLGAFEETALTEDEAWAANADLDGSEAHDGP